MTNSLHTNMMCRLKVLTPVHIGNGHLWKRGIDYIPKGKEIHVLDQAILLERLEKEPARGGKSGLEEYIAMFSGGQTKRIERLLDQFDITFDNKIAPIKLNYREEPSDEIRPLLRTGMGTPLLPGSSIKGAIRSVLFNYLWKKEGKNANDEKIDNRLLGSFERAITRYIAPSDVEIPQTEILNAELFNLQKPGFDWKSYYGSRTNPQAKVITLETFSVNAEGTMRLSIADGWLKLIQEAAKNPNLREGAEGIVHPNTKQVIREKNPIQHIFKFINEYTREHLRREIAFFEEYREAEHTDFIIYKLYELKQKTENNPRSCILRMSFGSGYHGITGDWMVEDHVAVVDDPVWLKIQREGKDYSLKSRRIAKNAALTAACMGFVELTLPEGVDDIPFDKVFATEIPVAQIGKKVAVGKIEPPKKEAKTVAFANIKDKTVFQAEVIEPGKPFSKVKLLIDGYPFEPFAQLSGTKKVNLQPGLIVDVVVNSRSQNGEIKNVTYWGA